MEKNIIRKQVLTLRNKEDVSSKSEDIKKRLFALPDFKSANTILFYVSKANEVETREMIKDALNSKRVVVPIIEKRKRLTLSEIHSLDELEKSTFGVFEPKKEFVRPLRPENIDLIIVPGIAFDINGNRIGYGQGYYDRLLKRTRTIPFIGLACESQLVLKIPCDSQDVPVHKIITEKRVIECKGIKV